MRKKHIRIDVMKEYKKGTKIEMEHQNTAKYIKNYVKRFHKAPSTKAIASSIAIDHIKENKQYYKKLKKAKL